MNFINKGILGRKMKLLSPITQELEVLIYPISQSLPPYGMVGNRSSMLHPEDIMLMSED
jgi:hypothetical protein